MKKQAKIKELLENLKIIGQNNIRAMYVGVNDEDNSNKRRSTKQFQQSQDINRTKRPKLIGRLATTIIMEDGLWIG